MEPLGAVVDSTSQQPLSSSGEVQTATAEILLASVELWKYFMRRARLRSDGNSDGGEKSVTSALHSPAGSSIASCGDQGHSPRGSCFAIPPSISESTQQSETFVNADHRRRSRVPSDGSGRRQRMNSQSPHSPRGLSAVLSEHRYVEQALLEYKEQASVAELMHLPVGVFRNAILDKANSLRERRRKVSTDTPAPSPVFPSADRWSGETADQYTLLAKSIVSKYITSEANGRVVNLRSFAPDFKGPRYLADASAATSASNSSASPLGGRREHSLHDGSDDGRHDLTPASTLEAGTNSEGRSSMDRRDSDNSSETPRITGLVSHVEASSTGGSFPLPSPRSDHSSLVIDKLSFSASNSLRDDGSANGDASISHQGTLDQTTFDESRKVLFVSGSKSNHLIDVDAKVLVRIWSNRRDARRLHRGLAAVNEAIASLLLPQCFSAPYSVLLKVEEAIVSVTWLVPITSEQPIKLTDKSNIISLRRFAERCLDLVLSPTTSLSCESPMEKRKRSMSSTEATGGGTVNHAANVETVYMVEGRDGRYYVVYQDLPESPDSVLQRRNTGLTTASSGNPIYHAVDLHRFPSGVLFDTRRHSVTFDACARGYAPDDNRVASGKVSGGTQCATADCVPGASAQFSLSRDLFQISATRLKLAEEQKAMQAKRDSLQPGAAAAEVADDMLRRNRSVGFQESGDGTDMLKKGKTTGAPTAMIVALSPVMFINTSQFLKGILFRQCSDGTGRRKKRNEPSPSEAASARASNEDLTNGILHALEYASQLTKEETPLALLLYVLCGQIAPVSIGSFGKKIAKKLSNASLLQNDDWEADTYCIADVSILLAAELMAFRERLEAGEPSGELTALRKKASLDEARVAITDVCCVWGTAVSRIIQHIGYCRSFSLFHDVMQRVVLPDHHHSHLCEQGGAALTFPRAMSEEEEVRSKVFGTAEEERKAQVEAREKHPGIAVARGVLLPLTFGIDCRHNDTLQYTRNLKYYLFDPTTVVETREEMLAREAKTAKMKALSDFLTAKAATRRKGNESSNGVLVVDRLNLACWHLCYAPLLLPERLPLLVHVVGLLLDTAEQHSNGVLQPLSATSALPKMELKRRTFLLLAKALGIVIASRVTRISVTGTVLSKCIEAARALIVSLNDDLDEDILRTGLKHLSYSDAEVLTVMISDDLKEITDSVLLSNAYKKSQVQALRDLEGCLRRTPFSAQATSRSQSLASSFSGPFLPQTVVGQTSVVPVELSAEALAALPLPSRQRIERNIWRARQQSLAEEPNDQTATEDKAPVEPRCETMPSEPKPPYDGRASSMSLRLPSVASPSPKGSHAKRLFSQVARKVSHAMVMINGMKGQGGARSKSMGAIDTSVVASPSPTIAPKRLHGRSSASPLHIVPHPPHETVRQTPSLYDAEIPRLTSAMSTPMPPESDASTVLSPWKLPQRSHLQHRSHSFHDHDQRNDAVISPSLIAEDKSGELPTLCAELDEAENNRLHELVATESEEMEQRTMLEKSESSRFASLESLHGAEVERLLVELLSNMQQSRRTARDAASTMQSPKTPVKIPMVPRAPPPSNGSPLLHDSLNSNHHGSFSLRRQGSSRGLFPVLVGSSPLHSPPPVEQTQADSKFTFSLPGSDISHSVRSSSLVLESSSCSSAHADDPSHHSPFTSTLQQLTDAKSDALIVSERIGRRQVETEWQRSCDHLRAVPSNSTKSPYRCVIPRPSACSGACPPAAVAVDMSLDSPFGEHPISSLPLSVVSSLGGGGASLSDVAFVEKEINLDQGGARCELEYEERVVYHRLQDEFRKRMSQVALKVAMASMLPSLRERWSDSQAVDVPNVSSSPKRAVPSVGKAFLPLLPKM